MIVTDTTMAPPSACEAIADYLTRAIQTVQTRNSRFGPDDIRELAHGVAAYVVRDEPGDFAIQSPLLLAMTSRALIQLGEHELGRRLFLFGSGLVETKDSNLAGEQPMLILTLRYLTDRESDCLEITFFRGLAVALDAAAGVWDDSDGRGTLGLRDVRHVALALAGSNRARRSRIDRLSREMLEFCRRHLERCGAQRHWHHTPHILSV